jgi:APA family basic amino acid/polyamine antiporter
MPVGMALMGALVISLQNVIYTYDGWNGAIYFGGELRDPAREVPRAMAIGVLTVLGVYLALNAACLHVLGVNGLAGARFPASAAAGAVLGPNAESLVRGVMGVSLLGALSAIVLLASRVPYALGADGLMPRAATRVNAGGAPTVGLAFSAIVTIAFVATGTFETVIAIASLFFVLKYCVSFAAVMVLRRKDPTPRAYSAWGYPWITSLLLIGSVGFVVGNFVVDRTNSLIGVAVIVVSYPVYAIARRARHAA